MDVAAGITDVFIDVGEEGDHVVPHFGFDFENALHLETGFGLNCVQGLLRHSSEAAIGFSGSDLDIQPALEFGLLAPDGPHLGQGVALDHRVARQDNPKNLWGRLRALKNLGKKDFFNDVN